MTIGSEIYKKSLVGIIGLGRIGSNVAKFCYLMGANVIYFDKKRTKKKKHFQKTTLEYLLKKKSDIISINIPAITENYNLLSKNKIKLIKKGAIVINTSRGEIIDEKYILNLAKKSFFIIQQMLFKMNNLLKK